MKKKFDIEGWGGELLDEDLGTLAEQVGISGRRMRLGGNHWGILMAMYRYNCASYFENPGTILEEAGYGARITADGYTIAEQEYVDSML